MDKHYCFNFNIFFSQLGQVNVISFAMRVISSVNSPNSLGILTMYLQLLQYNWYSFLVIGLSGIRLWIEVFRALAIL